MWTPMTEKDFPKLMETVRRINDGYVIHVDGFEDEICQPFDLHIKIETINNTNCVTITDYNEELTYDGFLTERTMKELDAALKEDTGDENAYFDAVTTAEWSADWTPNKSKYDRESLRLDISIGIHEALIKYIDDNGIKPKWTNEQKKIFDEAEKHMFDTVCLLTDMWKLFKEE